MIDPHFLALSASALLGSSTDAELEQRLGLYQVFLKLYEHHRSLLDEILELETGGEPLAGLTSLYIQGMVNGQQAFLLTNLLAGKTQALYQSQRAWTIGRSRRATLSIQDKRLSRCHAAIQYIEDEGFYLVYLSSTNGSFVNGEQVRQRIQLRDGDRVRLSSLAFTFFTCSRIQTADELPTEVLEQLKAIESALAPPKSLDTQHRRNLFEEAPIPPNDLEDTSFFLQSGPAYPR